MQLTAYFRIPTIIFSSIESAAAVRLNSYLQQPLISSITCVISLVVGIINSIEIFLKINETCQLELQTAKEFYNLGTDIHKILGLMPIIRSVDGKDSLDEFYRRYVELMDKSNLISSNSKDLMIKLPRKRGDYMK
jgi:hypothetical protein